MLDKTIGGRYRIIRYLGGGGFGQTYLAADLQLPGKPNCVVKQLKPQSTDPHTLEIARRLFDGEAEALYKLGTHPQIPRLMAHFAEEAEFFLVQEFIDGQGLDRELVSGEKLGEAHVFNLLLELLDVLSFVHQQNVIHRDIKPANIIRPSDGRKLVLIDFGAMKEVSSATLLPAGQDSRTVAIGTPGYMPNEQLGGKPRLCSDIYAVGMIGIQALTGVPPHQLPDDPKTGEILWRIHTHDSQVRVPVSSALATVLETMVRYDFRQRYPSAVEALHALRVSRSSPVTRRQENGLPAEVPTIAPPTASPLPTQPPDVAPTLAVSPAFRPASPEDVNGRVGSPRRRFNLGCLLGLGSLIGISLIISFTLAIRKNNDVSPGDSPSSVETPDDSTIYDVPSQSPTPTPEPIAPTPSDPPESPASESPESESPASESPASQSTPYIYVSDTGMTVMEDIGKVCETKANALLFYRTQNKDVDFEGTVDFSRNRDTACNDNYKGTFIDRGSDGQVCVGTLEYYALKKDDSGVSKVRAYWVVEGSADGKTCDSSGEKFGLMLTRKDGDF